VITGNLSKNSRLAADTIKDQYEEMLRYFCMIREKDLQALRMKNKALKHELGQLQHNLNLIKHNRVWRVIEYIEEKFGNRNRT
jgi:hypothetical protein